jgi:hypothetical protein
MSDSQHANYSPVDAPASATAATEVAGASNLKILRRQWSVKPGDFHAELLQVIYAHERDYPGLQVSNVGAWHSRPELHLWTEPCVAPLLERIWAAAQRVTTEALRMHAWANVTRYGGHHLAHRHGEALWSGVYYVAAGDDGAGGTITFAQGSEADTIVPRNGLMLLFPGTLLHSVSTYRGSTPRVSIAFNLAP